MIDVASLPALNATLNATAAMLLVAGWFFIKAGRRRAHTWLMSAALAVSTLFLISYLVYHAIHGDTKFQGSGPAAWFYFTVLITHIILAMVVPPMAIVAVWHAIRQRFARHTRITRWLYPIWLYVSVTGVIIYVMLYHLYA